LLFVERKKTYCKDDDDDDDDDPKTYIFAVGFSNQTRSKRNKKVFHFTSVI
jgi:hypothetical protein